MNTIDFLKSVKGQTTVAVVMNTEVKVPKKYGLSGKVYKNTSTNVIIGLNYASEVESRKEEGTEYVAGQSWGTHYNDCLVENNGVYYMQYYPIKDEKSEKVYTVDGHDATEDELEIIKMYEDSKKKTPVSKPQSDCGITKENEVMVRRVKVENIINLAVA